MNRKKYRICIVVIALTVYCFFIVGITHADVSVYAEGAYTRNDLKVYIYADLTGEPLVSYGVKLTYDSREVHSPNSVKNSAAWYFGSADAPLPTPKAAPVLNETSDASDIVLWAENILILLKWTGMYWTQPPAGLASVTQI